MIFYNYAFALDGFSLILVGLWFYQKNAKHISVKIEKAKP